MIHKVLTLGILYFVQGLPYGFQDKFIPMYLRTAGLSHTKLSLMKLLLVPWLCKAGFGPLIDLIWTKWLWLLFNLIVLAFISFCGIFIDPTYFAFMCAWLLLLNLFSAFQDVSVDGLAMYMLKESELGHCNSAQIIGYKLGALFGGGILFWVNHFYGWPYLCLSLTSLYVMSVIAFLPMFFHNSKEAKASNSSSSDNAFKNMQRRFSEVNVVGEITNKTTAEVIKKDDLTGTMPRQRYKEEDQSSQVVESESISLDEITSYSTSEIPRLIFTTRGTIPAVIFLLIYKLGERGVLSTYPIFLVDQGVPSKTIGFWSGLIGQIASLLGSVCSGWVISQKKNVREFFHLVLVAKTVPIIVLWIIINVWFSVLPTFIQSFLFFLSILSLITLELTAGLVTTLAFTMMMSCSLKAPVCIQATHYSVLSTVEISGKLLLSSFSGALIDWLGLSQIYFMYILLSILPVFVLPFMVN